MPAAGAAACGLGVHGADTVGAALAGGADVSITVCLDPLVNKAIETIAPDAWTTIEYPEAIRDDATGAWISRAEVAEIPYTAFSSKKKAQQVTGRLVVRRIPDLNTQKASGQEMLFDTWRYHPFFTDSTEPVADADITHRDHAIIETVFADLIDGPLAHIPDVIFSSVVACCVDLR